MQKIGYALQTYKSTPFWPFDLATQRVLPLLSLNIYTSIWFVCSRQITNRFYSRFALENLTFNKEHSAWWPTNSTIAPLRYATIVDMYSKLFTFVCYTIISLYVICSHFSTIFTLFDCMCKCSLMLIYWDKSEAKLKFQSKLKGGKMWFVYLVDCFQTNKLYVRLT